MSNINALKSFAQKYKCAELLTYLEEHLQKRSSMKILLDQNKFNSNGADCNADLKEENLSDKSGKVISPFSKRDLPNKRDSSSLLEEMFNLSEKLPALNPEIAHDQVRRRRGR